MLRLLMIVSGTIEVLFGLSTLAAPDMLIGALAAEPNVPSIFLARVFGAATLGLGVAALLSRDHLASKGGLAAAYGLGLYNVLAAALILWTARETGDATMLGVGLIHAAVGALFVYALAKARG